MRLEYLAKFAGEESILFRGANKILGNKLRQWKLKQRYNRGILFFLKNYLECEAHLELIQKIIHNEIEAGK